MSSLLDDRQQNRFLEEIQARPAIWDKGAPCYKNRNAKKNAWDEIRKIFNPLAVDDLKKCWKSMQNTHRKMYKKYLKGKSGNPSLPIPPGFTAWVWYHGQLNINEMNKTADNMDLDTQDESLDYSNLSDEEIEAEAENVIAQLEEELDKSSGENDTTTQGELETTTDQGEQTTNEDQVSEEATPPSNKKVKLHKKPSKYLTAQQEQDKFFMASLATTIKELRPPAKAASPHEQLPDYHFCMSILYEMNEMTPDRKKLFKQGVNKLLYSGEP